MSYELSYLFEGDFHLKSGSDIDLYGPGDLYVNRNGIFNGTTPSLNSTTGSLVAFGGLGVLGDVNFQQNLNVIYGTTELSTTHINTSIAQTTISGRYGLSVSVGEDSSIVSTGGNLELSSLNQSVNISGSDLVTVSNSNVNGNITLISGVNTGVINLISGSGGISGVTSSGSVSFTTNNASANFSVNSTTVNQDLLIALNGNTDSQLKLESHGTSSTKSAIKITTVNTAGNIEITNISHGSGSISFNSGSGGLVFTTASSGSISSTSFLAPTSIIVESDASGQDLSLTLNGTNTNSILSLNSFSKSSEAIKLQTLNTGGSIVLSSLNAINAVTGIGGFNVTSASINLDSYGAVSHFINHTVLDAQDLTISVLGDTDSSLVLYSEGTNDAISITTSSSTGSILMQAGNSISLQASNGNISIGTSTPGLSVNIGTSTSTTTINGDLFVKGVTTTIDSETVTVKDNIIVVNSSPITATNGGMAIKRYQYSNNLNDGEVILGTPIFSGTISTSGNSFTTLNIGVSASSVDDYYNNCWIRISSGTGSGQVRLIKDYNGTTRIATIFSTADQAMSDAVPVEGLDFLTIPDTTSGYSIYSCYYALAIWDESGNEFAFKCSPTVDSLGFVDHYANVHVNTLTATNVSASFINSVPADVIITFSLNNNSATPVLLNSFPLTYGNYMVRIRPSDSNSCYATFELCRSNIITASGTCTRISSAPGANNEKLKMQWNANSKPEIFYAPSPNTGGTREFVMRITSV